MKCCLGNVVSGLCDAYCMPLYVIQACDMLYDGTYNVYCMLLYVIQACDMLYGGTYNVYCMLLYVIQVSELLTGGSFIAINFPVPVTKVDWHFCCASQDFLMPHCEIRAALHPLLDVTALKNLTLQNKNQH